MPVDIHGKQYKTVAERLDEAHKAHDLLSCTTEVLFLEPQVMVKATITTKIGVFTGISAADPQKSIERKTPVEVAETSAVGRALAFAGYAGSEIASADEMQKALTQPTRVTERREDHDDLWCDYHKTGMRLNKNGKPYHRDDQRGFCNGRGYSDEIQEWKDKVYSKEE